MRSVERRSSACRRRARQRGGLVHVLASRQNRVCNTIPRGMPDSHKQSQPCIRSSRSPDRGQLKKLKSVGGLGRFSWPQGLYDPNWLWLSQEPSLGVAAVGAVVMSMHSSLSPLVDVALMVMSALARLLGRALDNRISTGTLTAPAANGHLTPSYVMEPTPNGRVNVCAAHTSPE